MLYRIVMHVLDMADKIQVIYDLMFPETSLPDCLLPLVLVADCSVALEFLPAVSAEIAFDLTPSCREIVVILRQCPNAVQMIGQQNKSVKGKWMTKNDIFKRFTQQIDIRSIAENRAPFVCDNCKKECCAFCP